MTKRLRIVFMGTPDFAVPSLQKLVEEGFAIAAVITAPDKPAGRGLQLQESPVKKYALANKLPVLQPANLKSPAFIEQLKQLNADLQVVVAFRMLPEIVWRMPSLGTINLHASLLPDYRGAAPINHAIINGETETGLTTFFIKKEIDTGEIIFSEKIHIAESDTAGTLHDKMMYAGADLLLKTVLAIESGQYPKTEQTGTSHKLAPKLFKENCRIQWNQSTTQVYNFIRGLSPYPAAWTMLDNKTIKLLNVSFFTDGRPQSPGSLLTDKKTYLRFTTADGYIEVLELQLEGKKKLPVAEFLKGYRFN
ncbi:MAG: methionyl-tRNA formyltransferase [Chitinophagales bacterium]